MSNFNALEPKMSVISKEDLKRIQVSSVVRNDKSFGKQNLFDGKDDTCWSSDEGSPQWVLMEFTQPRTISSFSIQFQGGFVGKECQALFFEDAQTTSMPFFPEDVNSVQKFTLLKPSDRKMDDKLNELKEKQAQIGDKISLLQATNKRKDEEAAEIRKLIAECRENLNRIKGISPGADAGPGPCEALDQDTQQQTNDDGRRPCGSKPKDTDRRRCEELLAKRECKPDCASRKKKKRGNKDRVSCKVDLNKMRVRIRGPSEDLKKLDATQLINLLEKFQCQELIITTGAELIQDPGEIRFIYFLHPGNIIMAAGIIMIAFLINTNICRVGGSCSSQLLFNVLYVGGFAFHYGMVLWMFFVRGYALRFGLNHDTFHLVDNLILPKYYSVCVLLSALSLYSFLAVHCVAPCSSWPLNVLAQAIIVVTTFFMELITICYVIPALIKLRDATDDYVFDDEEPDCAVPQSYEKNLVKLGKLNWTLCLINFLTLIFLGANIYYITSKLDFGSAN